MSDIGKAYVQIEPTAKGISKKIEGEMSSAGASGGKSFGSAFSGAIGGLGSVVAGVGKVAAGALAAGTAAVASFSKEAVSSFAEFEQLEGGISKLYGTAGQSIEEYAASVNKSVDEVKDTYGSLEAAQDLVFKNAQEAYKNAGMSANEYMETATSFSAALVNSLGGDTLEAAKQTDVAMRAISDNVNTFGSDMTSVTNAFQGFAKGNYTMLDNLKLGYGGTESEMKKLIDDANEWAKANGQAADLSIDSFSDVVTAIELIQEKQNIAGTTSREAMKTIEGSWSATQAAWSNLVSAIGSGEGIDQAFGNLTSVILGEVEGEGLLNQVLPRVQTILDGIGNFLRTAMPQLLTTLPEIIKSFLPSLMTSATYLIKNLIVILKLLLPDIIAIIQTVLPDVINVLVSLAPLLATTAIQLMGTLASALIESLPEIMEALLSVGESIIGYLSEMFSGLDFAEVGAKLGEWINGIVSWLADFLSNTDWGAIAQSVFSAITVLLGNIDWIALAANLFDLLLGMLSAAVQLLFGAVGGIFDGIASLFESVGLDCVAGFLRGIADNLVTSMEAVKEFFSNIINKIKEFLGIHSPSTVMAQIGDFLVQGFINGIKVLPEKALQIWNKIITAVKNFGTKMLANAISIARKFATNLVNGLKELPTKMLTIGKDIVEGIKKGISNAWEGFKEWLKKILSSAVDAIKDFFGIGSPSKLMRDEVGRWIPAGIAEGIRGGIGDINDAVDDVATSISTNPKLEAMTYGENLVSYDSENSVLEILSTYLPYLPIIAQPDNITVGLEPDSARFFKMMKYEAAKNAQLIGV